MLHLHELHYIVRTRTRCFFDGMTRELMLCENRFLFGENSRIGVTYRASFLKELRDWGYIQSYIQSSFRYELQDWGYIQSYFR